MDGLMCCMLAAHLILLQYQMNGLEKALVNTVKRLTPGSNSG